MSTYTGAERAQIREELHARWDRQRATYGDGMTIEVRDHWYGGESVTFHACRTCGSMVVNLDAHDKWHVSKGDVDGHGGAS